MKAAVLEGIKKITVKTDVPEPTVGPRDVLVRARACGICGTDVHIWEGDFFPTFPLVPGHELAGEVARVGAEVTDLAVGDRVMVDPTVTCEECHFCMINRQNHCLRWNAFYRSCGPASPSNTNDKRLYRSCNNTNDGRPEMSARSKVRPMAKAMRKSAIRLMRLGAKGNPAISSNSSNALPTRGPLMNRARFATIHCSKRSQNVEIVCA